MFDVLVAAAPRTPFSERVTGALRDARLRVIACEVGPKDRPPSGFRVDAAVVCAESASDVSAIATGIRATVEGPPQVVGVTRGAAAPPVGTVEVLRDDVPASLLVARVQRAAAARERTRSRILLSGALADVGARELLASLSSRRKSCVVKVRADGRRAEVALDEGRVVHARADGTDAATAEGILAAVSSWKDATFEVHGSAEATAQLTANDRPTVRPPLGGDATEVALAAAVMNAFAGYARAYLPSEIVTRSLEQSRIVARRIDTGIDAFAVSYDGIISVSHVTLARRALPNALGAWSLAFFEECAQTMPTRFRRDRVGDVLGGLTRLIQQVGWGSALIPNEVA